MPNIIRIKRSASAANVPATSSLLHGELAINTVDSRLYYGKVDGTTGVLNNGDMLRSVYDKDANGIIDVAAHGTGTPTVNTYLNGAGAWAAEIEPVATATRASVNNNLAGLAAKTTADGRQLADGSLWTASATGTANNGTIVAGTGCLWVREYTGPVMASWFGVLPTATAAANSAALQQCLDAVHALGGGTILINPGVFNFSAAVKTYGFINLQGTRKATTFRTVADNGFIYTDTGLALEGIRISGIIFRREITAAVTWHVRLTDTANSKVEDCEFWQTEWTLNANNTPNVTYYTVTAGLWCESTGTGNSFMAQVTRCWFRGCMLNVQQSDSRVSGCYLWGQARQYSLKIDAANVSVTDCDLIPSIQKGAIWITGNGKWFLITGGNRIDGSYNTIPTGDGVLNEGAYGGVISGNNFYQCGKSAIHFVNAIRCSIGANAYLDNNRINDPAALTPATDTFAYPDVMLDNCQMIRVESGTHSIAVARNRTGGGGSSYAIREVNACDNNVISATVQGTYLAAISRAGANTIIGPSFNANNNRADRNAGSGTIAAAATNVIIAHGLGVTPKRVMLTLTSALGAAKSFFRGGMDATNLVAQVDVAPGGSGLTFDWIAEL